ncbi:uncharacterized protein [Aegilops tauschii subsp. strangulata]|uniref:uncharacterized protein n=1 Tax=Aegilops tauschii subsp. strangulata TaxID=200361 RepID=UPI00098B22E7|nr:uncharacterized protein LOC109782234 [Aegilops tauschii subsp. strangulata]
MSSDGEPTVAVKLFIDKEKKKVLFAESNKDFVDVLFSFLTLPLGTIVRLFDKQSQVGCLDELYKSVEVLGPDHFQTKACKAMLLSPLNAAAIRCNRLKVKVVDKNLMYRCKNTSCGHSTFSSVPDAICSCGHVFIVTDDLQVAPASTRVMFSLIEKYGIPEKVNIQEKVLQLNSAKMIGLFRRALLTKQVLTGLYFDVAIPPNAADMCVLPDNMFAKQALETDPKFKAIKIRLVHAKDDSVLYAEVGQDFVDIVFGILTTPLGTMLKTFTELPRIGCIGSIYKSVVASVKQECQGLLLSPNLAPFFGCSSNVLQVEELVRRCLWIGSTCCIELNPKSTSDRAYIKGGPMNFMVTDDLQVRPFCLINTLEFLRASKIPKDKLVEKELTLNKTQVMKLVGPAFGTSKALSSVLMPCKK